METAKIFISAYSYPGLKYMPTESEKSFMPNEIVAKVCRYFKVEREQIESKTRRREIVYVRQVCMYMLKSMTNLSLVSIGTMLGNRDHTTVLHSIERVKELIQVDELTASTDNVKKDLQNLTILL